VLNAEDTAALCLCLKQHQVHHQDAVLQDNITVQMAGVYQFLLHVLRHGVSHGTSAVMVSRTVPTTATRTDAVSLHSTRCFIKRTPFCFFP